MSDASRIIDAIHRGDPDSGSQLLPLVYEELRRLAARKLAREPAGQTLQPTALVHEAYLRLLGPDDGRDRRWDGRGHFFAAAAEAMRRILIENARRKQAGKRGAASPGGTSRGEVAAPEPPEDLLALDEALGKLEAANPRVAELVKLRYFAGLTIKQAAEVLDVSPRTADSDWAYARAWLLAELRAEG